MTAKLLQGLGVAFVLILVGGAIGGFMVLKDRVKIVVAADEAATGPDPIALLADDVKSMGRDLGALQQALGGNFEQLGNALEERAAARHADVQAVQQQVAALRQQLAALAAESSRHGTALQGLQALPAQIAALAASGAAAPGPAATPPAPAPVTPVAADPSPPPTEPAVNQEPTTPAPGAAQPAAKPAGKPGFLSFSVPTSTFRFDALQDYTLVPELCRVGFDAKSTLHDFTGVTSKVRGSFRADFDDPAGAWTGDVAVAAATLVTGVDGRDENMREHLDTKAHAEIRFQLEGFQPAEGGIDVAKQTVRGEVRGTMTIRGKQQPLKMPVTVEVDAQKRVVVKGQTPLKLSDYGVPVPSQLGLINMQDEVVVWIALRARAAAGVAK